MNKGVVPLFQRMPLSTRFFPKDCSAFGKQCRTSRPPEDTVSVGGQVGGDWQRISPTGNSGTALSHKLAATPELRRARNHV